MRARELLQEDYNQSLESDLNNLLVAAKGNGVQQLSTQDVVTQLYGMGYSVDNNNIMSLLSTNPVVMSSTPEMITLVNQDKVSQEPVAGTKDSAARVSDMAKKATNIG